MQIPIRRFGVVTGFVLLLIALIANAWIIRSRLGVQIGNQNRMAQSRQALYDLAQIELLLNEAESGQRGFLYTGDPKYLKPFDVAKSQIAPHLTSLAQLTVEGPFEQSRIPILRNLIRIKLLELAQTITLYQSGRSQEAKTLVLSDAGLIMMNDIRNVIYRMGQQEKLQEANQYDLYQRSKRVTIACIYLTNLGAALGLMLLAYHIHREMRAREEDARQIREREQEVREREVLLLTVTEQSHVGLTMFGADRRYIYANLAYAALLNLSTVSFKGKRMVDVMGEVYGQLAPWIERALTGERVEFEITVPIAPDPTGQNESRFYDITYQPLQNPGEDARVIGVTVDVTLRKRAEEILLANEQRLRLAQSAAGMGTFDVELPSGKRRWSRELHELFGREGESNEPTDSELLGMCHPDDRALVADQLKLVAAGKRIRVAYRIIRPNGDMRWIETAGTGVFNEAGFAVRHIGVGYDITERKLGEDQLRRSKDQLRALAARLQIATEGERLRIARELHDQLGQALTGIKMDLDWIVRKQGADGGIWVSMVKDSIKGVESTLSLVRRLATELRPEILDTFGLRAAIQGHAEQFQRRMGIVCVVAVPESPLGVSEDHKIAVFRIFQEALTNVARHASAKNVLITLEREQDVVILTVHDDGVGFVIDPREPTQSLGILGMQERAVLLGAEFFLESEPGHGTTLTLKIPLEDAGAAEPEAYEHIDS